MDTDSLQRLLTFAMPFGKYKGRPVAEVFRAEPSYYAWMMNGDFPLYTKKVITEIRMREKTK